MRAYYMGIPVVVNNDKAEATSKEMLDEWIYVWMDRWGVPLPELVISNSCMADLLKAFMIDWRPELEGV